MYLVSLHRIAISGMRKRFLNTTTVRGSLLILLNYEDISPNSWLRFYTQYSVSGLMGRVDKDGKCIF